MFIPGRTILIQLVGTRLFAHDGSILFRARILGKDINASAFTMASRFSKLLNGGNIKERISNWTHPLTFRELPTFTLIQDDGYFQECKYLLDGELSAKLCATHRDLTAGSGDLLQRRKQLFNLLRRDATVTCSVEDSNLSFCKD